MSWRCTIVDPATGRDAYVRFHYGPFYEVAIPSIGNVHGKNGIVETSTEVHALAKKIVESGPGEYLFTVDSVEKSYVVQFYGGPEVCIRVWVSREADDYAHGMFQKAVKAYAKPKARR